MFNRRLSTLILSIILITSYFGKLNAQTDDKIRAMWVFNVSQYITWENEDSITEINVGVYGISKTIFTEISSLAETRTIKSKPVKTHFVKKIKEITDGNYQITFICNDRIDEVPKIYSSISGINTLLITDRSSSTDYSMINILPLDQGTKRFEVNEVNLISHDFVAAKELLYHGGSETELKGLYSQTEKELEEKRLALEDQQKVLELQQSEIGTQKSEIEKQKEDLVRQIAENESQKVEMQKQQFQIEEQGEKIEGQKDELALTYSNLLNTQDELRANLDALNEQEEKLEMTSNEYDAKQEELKLLEEEISEAKASFTQQIEDQRLVLIYILVFAAVIFFFFIIAFRGYRINKKINAELNLKNIEINKQKDEIVSQAHLLEESNRELEKLSIVASRTQNAVTIMDKNGNFEWVNSGFTRMYGFTLQLLVNERDENIRNASSSNNISKHIDACIHNKQSVVYEAETVTRDGQKLWVQTTLTPILNEENEVVRLVAIDSDITEVKNAENEIREQHKLIAGQAKLLEESNHELEKLSIVASETDNAVLIMDAQGNFEWVNQAYTRMFGYTYDQLTTGISKNIVGNRTDEATKKIVKDCIDKKKTINYQFQTKTKSGNNIWVQTTLTPIVGNNGVIKKLIAIDSDITKLKEAEFQILEKNEELNQQKEKIELQNSQIHSSIKYAQTIQKAILPIEEQMNFYFDSFVIFLPKDVVSGDFYWFAKPENSNKVFVAAVDCTGHGVPGAFMSLIGSRLLNEIIIEKKIFDPDLILDFVNEGVKKSLKQEFSDNNDGMDLCLCSLEKNINQNTIVTFCGAKRPLFYYSSKEKVVKTIKGSRKSIGGVRSKRNIATYENQTLELLKNDIIYLTTDGFTDQNNPERQRMGTTFFVNKLNKIAHLTLEQQKSELEVALFSHMKDAEQRDDITVFCVKIR